MSKVHKIISEYPVKLSNFIVIINNTSESNNKKLERLENVYIDLYNSLEKFKKKRNKLEKELYKYKNY
jgi:hypothetical protein